MLSGAFLALFFFIYVVDISEVELDAALKDGFALT